MGALTHRQLIVLAALSAGAADSFTPVQVQKMFFLLDENISGALGGKLFSFEPYDYGPFDKTIYAELATLERFGLVEITAASSSSGGRRYFLTQSGRSTGLSQLDKMNPQVRRYMDEVSNWVRRLTFAQLVGSIYKAYPHMRENSIFVEK